MIYLVQTVSREKEGVFMREKQNQRTKRSIVDAFLRLLDKKSYDRITVQDILDETPISRSSFYTYFRDKHDIAEYLQQTLLEAIEGLGYALVFYDSPGSDTLPVEMPDTFKQYRPVLLALLKIHTEDVDILGKLTASIRRNYIESARHKNKRFLDVEADMYADIFARFIVYSLMTDRHSSEVMQDFRTMYTNVFFRLLTLEEDTEKQLRSDIDKAVKKDHQQYIKEKRGYRGKG
jgi:AcrR family transcriptional regulator